jgi:hypothetical protein
MHRGGRPQPLSAQERRLCDLQGPSSGPGHGGEARSSGALRFAKTRIRRRAAGLLELPAVANGGPKNGAQTCGNYGFLSVATFLGSTELL